MSAPQARKFCVIRAFLRGERFKTWLLFSSSSANFNTIEICRIGLKFADLSNLQINLQISLFFSQPNLFWNLQIIGLKFADNRVEICRKICRWSLKGGGKLPVYGWYPWLMMNISEKWWISWKSTRLSRNYIYNANCCKNKVYSPKVLANSLLFA